VIQRQGGLDQAGGSRRGFGVRDLRLDAAQGNMLFARVIFPKYLAQPWNSAGSPAIVPVPCASIKPTVSGPKPASA
jgi:hypothetical protein